MQATSQPRFLFPKTARGYIQARRAKKDCFWPFVTRILTPRSRKSGHGLLLGCRSPLDAGHEKKDFDAFPPKKAVKALSDGRARHRNRSGMVELVRREPLIFARVENGEKTIYIYIYLY